MQMTLSDIQNLKIGDKVEEVGYGIVISCTVKTVPVCTPSEHGNQWTWIMTNDSTGQDIDYLVTEGFMHYAPNLYYVK